MDFITLYERVSPTLKKIARFHNGQGMFIDTDDLYQEMCTHLWNNFGAGVPKGINESYIVTGCKFHILNYLRKEKPRAVVMSLDEPLNEEGETYKDILPDNEEWMDVKTDRRMTLEYIRKNGFTPQEKEVFFLLYDGCTVREAAERLGMSHVMVVKIKKSLYRS